MAMTRGKAAGGVFKGMALIVSGEGFEDFAERIRLVAQGAGAGCEAAVAGTAVVDANSFQLLETAAFGGDFRAVAIRAPLRRLDRRRRGRRSECAVEHAGCHSTGRAKSHEFAKKDLGDVVPPSLKL